MRDTTKKFFRLGLVAKGVVYLLIGVLAITASGSTGSKDAIQYIAQQPFGQVLLIITALGLLGYAAWRWYRALADPDHQGSDGEGIAKRTGYAISGMIYASLAVYAASIVIGSGSSGGSSEESMTATLMSQPFGQWLVGIVGAILIGVGLYHLYKAFSEKYKESISMGAMSAKERKIFDISAKAGLSARGVVFGVLGYFLIQAAIQSNPGQAGGVGEALSWLQSSGFPWAATLVAIGLAAYGVYMFVMARYRPI